MISFSGFDIGWSHGVSLAHGVRMDFWREEASAPMQISFKGKGNMPPDEALEFARGSRIVVIERPDEKKGFRVKVAQQLMPVFYAAGEITATLRCMLPDTEVAILAPDIIRKSGCGWIGSPTSGKADQWIRDWYGNLWLPSQGFTRAQIDELLKSGHALGSTDKLDAGLACIAATKLLGDRLMRISAGLPVEGLPDPNATSKMAVV